MKQGWEIKKLGEVCKIMNGGTPDTKVAEFWDGDNLWITPKDMGKLSSRYVTETERRITEEGLKNSSAKILPVDSVILSSRAPIGHLAVNKKPISTNQGCKGLIPNKGLNTLYLYYFLSNSIELLNNLGSGTTFKELSGTKLSEVEIPITSLSDQERIVGILDSAFAKIEALRANAQQNLQNTKDLFQASLKQELTPKQKNKFKFVKDLFDIKTGKLNANAAEDDGIYPFFTCSRDIFAINKAAFDCEAILLAGNNASGDFNVKYYKGKFNAYQRTYVITPKSDKTHCRLLYYVLGNYLAKLKSMSVGANTKFLKLGMIENVLIADFTPSEQLSAIEKLDALSERCRAMEENYRQTIAHCSALKQALLTKAFNGEL